VALDVKQVTDQVTERLGKAAKQLSSGAGNAAKELSSGAGNAARELTNTADKSINKPIRKQWPRQRRGAGPWTLILGAAVGAVAVYFFDPERGKTRRAQFIDWTGARFRRGWRSVNQLTREAQSNAGGLSQRMISLRSGRGPVDDLTLRDRVESEVFRNRNLPKGQINFDVESAIVTIRGQVDNALQIATVEKAVLKVPGVDGVENLLHVQGSPAPNKQEARESTR
jgi:BON domain-containing protein